MVKLKANKFLKKNTLLFIILYHLADPPTSRALKAVTIPYLHLGALSLGRF